MPDVVSYGQPDLWGLVNKCVPLVQKLFPVATTSFFNRQALCPTIIFMHVERVGCFLAVAFTSLGVLLIELPVLAVIQQGDLVVCMGMPLASPYVCCL